MLFTSIAEIQGFFPVEKTMQFSVISPFIQKAEDRYIKKVLGTEQLEELQTAVDADTFTPEQEALLAQVRKPLIELALYIAIPSLQIRFSEIGLMKALSQDFDNATGGEVYFARTQLLIDGYRSLDNLYAFLEENAADYETWTASSAYSEFKEFFVATAAEFGKHVNAAQSRWLFVNMVPEMDVVEQLRVKPFLTADFFEDLKTKLEEGNLSEDEQTLITGNKSFCGLAKPVALYTYAQSLIDPLVREIIRITNAQTADELSRKSTTETNFAKEYAELAELKRAEADALMAQVKDYLNANADEDTFALWYESDKYVDPATASTSKLQNYNNDSSSSTFAML